MTKKKPGKKRVRSSSTKRGQPTKCTPERIAAIEGFVREGLGKDAAARQGGIGVATHHEWTARGRAGEEPYAEYVRRIQAASDSLQEEVSGVHMRALRSPNLQVAAPQARWMSERLWPETWGKREQVELTGKDGAPLEVAAAVAVRPLLDATDVANWPEGKLAEALAALLAAQPQPPAKGRKGRG